MLEWRSHEFCMGGGEVYKYNTSFIYTFNFFIHFDKILRSTQSMGMRGYSPLNSPGYATGMLYCYMD